MIHGTIGAMAIVTVIRVSTDGRNTLLLTRRKCISQFPLMPLVTRLQHTRELVELQLQVVLLLSAEVSGVKVANGAHTRAPRSPTVTWVSYPSGISA